MKTLSIFALSLISVIHASETHTGKGLVSGEPTHNSIILQTRLTSSPDPIDGILSGSTGVGRFEISPSSDFKVSIFSEWLTATPENDYILKTKITSLKPSTTYHYRIIHGPIESQTKSSTTATFKTLPSSEEIKPVSFILTSCLNYAFFQHGDKSNPPANANDRALGYPALEQIVNLKPDFVIFNGDCVYYDHPWGYPRQNPRRTPSKMARTILHATFR